MDFRKMAEDMESSHGISFFGSKISCCLKTGKYIPNHRSKNVFPEGWVFSISESWKLKIGHEKVIEFYCPISV